MFYNDANALEMFALLDDSDIVCAIKVWASHPDIVLSTLCKCFTNRRLFKVELNTQAKSIDEIEQLLQQYMSHFVISKNEARYFFDDEVVTTDTYNASDERINILLKDGTVADVAVVSDILNIEVLTKKVEKHYFCYHKI